MSAFTSFTTTPIRFTGLIVKQQLEQQSTATMGGPVFRDIVESPKGQIKVVRDLFGAFYLWISKVGQQEIPIRIIPIFTIQNVDAKKVRSKNESHERGKVCFIANSQATFPDGECQRAVAFQVKLPLQYYEDFVKIVKNGIKQPNGFSSFAIKPGTGTMKTFLSTDEATFCDLIVQKKKVHGGQETGDTDHTKQFYDVVESPKGGIKVVRDYCWEKYLWVSKNNVEKHVACIIPLSTIRDVKACKVHGKERSRVEVEFTANCQIPMEDHEFQHGAVFRVKLDNASFNKFCKIIGGLSNKNKN